MLIYGSTSGSGNFRLVTAALTGFAPISPPSIAISSAHPAAGNINANSTNNIIGGFQFAVTNATATFTGISVTTSGTYAASDIQSNGFKFWFNTSNSLSGATQIGSSQAAVGTGGTVAVSGLSQSISAGTSGYVLVTADIASTAVNAKTIGITSTAFSNITFSSGTKTGTDPVPASAFQTIVGLPSIAISPAHPTAGNVNVGSTNNIIAGIQLVVTNVSATLNSISLTTAGTYSASDIQSNGFKFWISSTNSLTGATQLGTSQAAVGTGGTVAVSGLSQSIASGTTRYILLTADIASGATPTNTIAIASTAFSSITFSSGNKTGTDPVPASNNQTIVSLTPDIAISAAHPAAGNVNYNTTNNIISSIKLDVTTVAANLTGISMTTAGTYTAGDIQTNGFKFWINSANSFSGATQLGTNQAAVGSGGTVAVSGLSQTLPIGTHYILMTADISATATGNNTIGVTSTPFSAITFTSGNKTGTDPVDASNLQTIVTPSVAISAAHPAAGTIYTNTTDNLISSIQLDVTSLAATLTGISVTTAGTYAASDIQTNGFKFWINSTNSLSGATQLGTSQAAVGSGGTVTVSGLSQSISAGTTQYILMSASIASGATVGNTIGISTTPFSSITFSNAIKTGTDPVNASNLQTIAVLIPDIAITAAHPAAGNVNFNTTDNIISSIKFDVTTTAATLNSISLTTAGSYSASDIQTNGFKFWINSTNSLSGATQIGASQAAVGTGGTVAVSGLSQTLPIGTRYIIMTASISVNATGGNTIGVTSTPFSNITFALGNLSGTDPVDASNVQTIQVPSVAISAAHPAAGTVNFNSTDNIIGSIQLNTTLLAGTFTGISVTTSGTYSASDIQTNGFKFWINSANSLSGATQLGSSQTAVGTGGIVAVSGLSTNLPVGTRYILVTASISAGAVGGNTIGIAATPFADITFSNATKTGTDPVSASNLQTIQVPSVAITAAHPAAGTIYTNTTDNLVSSIQLDVTTLSATLTGISVTTAGTYVASDIQSNGFKFWINSTNSLSGATQLGTSQAAVGTGGTVAVSGLSQSISAGTTRYILMSASIATGATLGNTIGISTTPFSAIIFTNATKIGSDPVAASNLQTIAEFQQFWRTDGTSSTWTSSVWGTSASGPFNNAWVSGSVVRFTANSSATFATTTVGNITIDPGINVTVAAGGTLTCTAARTFDVGANSTLTWTSQGWSASASSFGVIKSGAGTWNIGAQGNTVNTTNFGFTLNDGTVIVSGNNSFGGSNTVLTINGGTIQSSGGRTYANNITLGGNHTHTGSGNATFSGTVGLGAATRTITNSTSSGDRKYSGVISGTSGAGLIFDGTGSGTITLSGANTYTGGTTLNNGTLVLGASNVLADAGAVVVNAGTLNSSGAFTETIGALTLTSGSITGSTGTLTPTSITAESGSIGVIITGSCALTKNTGGTVTITNGATTSSFTGGATINGGILSVDGVNRLGSATGALTINAGTFQLTTTSITSGRNIILGNAASTIDIASGISYTATTGVISSTGAGALTKTGAGTLEIQSASTYTGLTTVSAGTFKLNRTGGTTIPATNSVTVDGGTFQVSSNQTLNTVTLSSGGTLVVDNGVTLTITGTFNNNGGTINLNSSGTIAYGASATLTYGGSSAQNATNSEFPASSGPFNLTINNSNGVSLNNLSANRTISGTLTLTSGKLSLGGNNLVIGSSGTIFGANSSNYIVTDGAGALTLNNVGSIAKLFPVGDVTYYTPVTITNGGTTDNFSVMFTSGSAPSCLTAASAVTATWEISEAVAGGSNCTIAIDYGSVPFGGSFNDGTAKIGHCTGTSYDYSNGSASGTLVTGTGFTSFSPFGITSEIPLPIELLSFNANLRNRKTYLNWATASEHNNAFFSIERSTDGVEFRSIGKVNGAGNSNSVRSYGFVDDNPAAGINYYRLKQVDFDGNFEHSKSVSVTVGKTGSITLSPVPAQDQLHVNLETALVNDGSWQLLDNTGRLIQSGTIPAETFDFNVDVTTLTPGAYFLRMVDGQTVVTKQFQK